MSNNSFIWVTEGGDLSTADWGCLASRCVLKPVSAGCTWWPCGWRLGLVMKSALRGVVREMRYTN